MFNLYRAWEPEDVLILSFEEFDEDALNRVHSFCLQCYPYDWYYLKRDGEFIIPVNVCYRFLENLDEWFEKFSSK